uniref:Pre-mRNA-splicing factor 18 n=1 Tax=Pavo cristatus TaxID=9049 RepID=A0A8C9ESN9_PAVCR
MDILKREISRKRQQLEDKELVGVRRAGAARGARGGRRGCGDTAALGTPHLASRPCNVLRVISGSEIRFKLRIRKRFLTRGCQALTRALQSSGSKVLEFRKHLENGLRNDLKAALDKIDQQYLNEIVGGQEAGDDDSQNDLKVHEENTTIEELEALGESLGRGDDHYDMDIITKFLKFLLGVWAKELNAREDYVKRGVQGKLNSATQKQTESYLRPLFRKLRKRTLPADIKESITDIIKFMLQREYVKANDAYLQMAIGNAPWPIGVTMVGIHARTGREKIFSKHVAHVLNDETQRKYIQGLKRLMTICQKHFPTDPSKCVEYNAL